MNKTFNICLMTLLISTVFQAQALSAKTNDITTGLISRWALDETSGTTLVNSVNPAFNATLAAAGSFTSTTGMMGNAIQLPGTHESFFKTPSLNMALDNATISFWVYADLTAASWKGLFYSRGAGGDKGLHSQNGTLMVGNWVANSASTSTLSIQKNKWTFVTLTVSPTTIEVKTRIAGSTTYSTWSQTGVFSGSTLKEFNIGGDGWDANMAGILDEVRIYNRVLTPGDLDELYTLGYSGPVIVAPVITASAEFTGWGGGLAADAFDDNIISTWTITNPNTGWIKVQYPVAQVFNYYTIVGTSADLGNIGRNPKDWTIEASNDNVVWTNLDTHTGIGWLTTSERKSYFFNNTTPYLYYRMTTTANNGNSHTQIAEIIYKIIPLDSEAPTAPTNLVNSNTLVNGFDLSWTAATDNIAVVSYDVYKDAVFYGTTTATSMHIECLPGTTYAMTVKAKDFRSNTSLASTPKSVTSPALAAVDFIVATTGNDLTGDGSLAKPYLTIQKAADMAAYGDVVKIRAGVYREAVDIKNNGGTFQSYNGESVTVNGADVLTSWTLEAGTTYKTTMDWDLVKWGSNQLFADGKMIELARWPNQTSTDIVMPTNAFADGVTVAGSAVTIIDADFNEPDGLWTGAKIWINLSRNGKDGQGFTATVTSTNAAAHTITYAHIDGYSNTPVLIDAPWSVGQNSEYFLFNPLSAAVLASAGGVDALLSNGEWWKDGNTVYVKTPTGAAPGALSNVIEAKKRHFGFYASTTKYGYTIKNINLFGCAITTDINAIENSNFYSSIVEAAHDIVLDGITAKYVSHQSIFTGNFQNQNYNWAGILLSGRNNSIQNCNIQYSATTALCISGFGIKVLNNTIANTNYMCSNSGALNTGYLCTNPEIANNTIYNTTVMAVNLGGLKNKDLNVPVVTRVHHNTIYNFLRRSGDSGAIDVAGKDLQWARIDHNTIYNNTPVVGTMIHGVYLDFGGGPGIDIGHCTVDHNVIYNVPQPVMISSVRHVRVYNNVLMSNSNPILYGVMNANGSTKGENDTIYNNIMNREPNVVGMYGYDLSKAIISNNITNATGLTLNTLFANAAGHDYRLISTATDAIDKGKSVGIFDDAVVGLPDIGAFEYGGSTDVIAPTIPLTLGANTITNTNFMLTWAACSDNVAVVNYEVYKDGVYYGSATTNSFLIEGLVPATEYSMTVKARDAAGNTSALSAGFLVTTSNDATPPTVPTALANTIPGTAFTLSWTAATDNIAVTAYDVYKDGVLYGTTATTSLFISGMPGSSYSMTVKAKDLAGNVSAASTPLVVATSATSLYAYEGFNGIVNSGTGWAGNWSRTITVSSFSGISFGSLDAVGNKLGGSAVGMTRPLYLGVTDGDSLCISYLCNENATDLSLILTSAAGGISLRNGKWLGDVNDAVQENSYASSNLGGSLNGNFTTPASTTGTTSFNLISIKRTGAQFELKRWVYTNAANLPSAMPVLGDAKAFTSGQYTSSDLGFLEITGINVIVKKSNATPTSAYYDEIRFGQAFADVAPQGANALSKNTMEGLRIYTQDEKVVVDLSDLEGASVISVYNTMGAVVKAIKSAGSEKLTFGLPDKGVYLVRVQNGAKICTQKVVLF